MTSKVNFIDYTNCDVYWFEVQLFGAYEGKYKAMLVQMADKTHWGSDGFNLYVWKGDNREISVTNIEIINLIYKAISDKNEKIHTT